MDKTITHRLTVQLKFTDYYYYYYYYYYSYTLNDHVNRAAYYIQCGKSRGWVVGGVKTAIFAHQESNRQLAKRHKPHQMTRPSCRQCGIITRRRNAVDIHV